MRTDFSAHQSELRFGNVTKYQTCVMLLSQSTYQQFTFKNVSFEDQDELEHRTLPRIVTVNQFSCSFVLQFTYHLNGDRKRINEKCYCKQRLRFILRTNR
jgi:hypothetical protein